MQRLPATLCRKIARPACEAFISHRGIDTKRNVAGLLYDGLTGMGVRSFLDSKSMKPGDRLFDHIDRAIIGCKVGVAVFSPRYCDSHFCLHELALLMESKKRFVPIFYDVKPSQLVVKDNGTCPEKELQRFHSALEEAKLTVGLTFDSLNGYVLYQEKFNSQIKKKSELILSIVNCIFDFDGFSFFRDWSELLRDASDAVIMNLLEVEEEEGMKSMQ